MTNKEIPMKVEELVYYAKEGEYGLVLKTKNNPYGFYNEKLKIKIDSYEARSIAFASARIGIPRPLIHDLFADLLKKTRYDIPKIVISDFRNGTYYANIFLSDERTEIIKIESRPCDAVAIALRENSDIFVYEKVLVKQKEDFYSPEYDSVTKQDLITRENSYNKILSGLQLEMKKAVGNENFKLADQIRARLISMKNLKIDQTRDQN